MILTRCQRIHIGSTDLPRTIRLREKEDKLGLDAAYIQAKRWENTVGRPIVQAFAGALMSKKANKGVEKANYSVKKVDSDYFGDE